MISLTCGILKNKLRWEEIHGCQRQSLGVRKMGEGQKVLTPSYKINHGDGIIYNIVTTVSNAVLHIWKSLRGFRKSPQHKKKKIVYYKWWQVLTRLIVVISLHYVQISNHHIPETNVVCQLYHNNNNLVWKIKSKIADTKFLESWRK